MNAPRRPTEKHLAKTNFGMIESLDELFDGFLYCRQETAKYGGTRTVKPDENWCFLSGIDTFQRVITFPTGHRHPGPCLYTKPKWKVVKAVMQRAMEGKMGSFSLTTWKGPGYDDGVTLVHATDNTMIPQIWLAFIETAKLPQIDESNTKIWTRGDPMP